MPDLRWDRATGAAERFRSVPSFAVTLVKASPIPRTEVQRAVVARVARVCLMEGKHTFLSNVLAVNANMTARDDTGHGGVPLAAWRPPLRSLHHHPLECTAALRDIRHVSLL